MRLELSLEAQGPHQPSLLPREAPDQPSLLPRGAPDQPPLLRRGAPDQPYSPRRRATDGGGAPLCCCAQSPFVPQSHLQLSPLCSTTAELLLRAAFLLFHSSSHEGRKGELEGGMREGEKEKGRQGHGRAATPSFLANSQRATSQTTSEVILR